jgi:3-oxoacyl-[acyl-carrier protein] reductase
LTYQRAHAYDSSVDLGIKGRRAIVCASSRGLGRACAEALAAEGVDLVVNGLDRDRLDDAARELRERHDVRVDAVAGDVTTKAGRDALLAACPEADILVNNNAGPGRRPFLENEHEDWMSAVEGNMVAAIMMIRSVLDGMRTRRFGRIVNITSAMVTTPWPDMGLSSGPRAGLTAVVKGLSHEVAADNVTINNLLPERFDTDRQLFMAQREMDKYGITFEEARQRQVESIAAKRLGRPSEFGAMCAFLCSEHAGYISGNSIHLDGGSYPALI